MPWYNRYFFHIFYGTITAILATSSIQLTKSIKQSKSKRPVQQKQYKDSI
jgi:hypothetical protein